MIAPEFEDFVKKPQGDLIDARTGNEFSSPGRRLTEVVDEIVASLLR
jgi:hypothetical protein